MQLNLFAPETRAPPTTAPPPERARFRVALERHKVKHPCGKPDKKGKYAYEKLHDELEKMPPMYRERFNDLTIELPDEVGNQFLKCFRMFMGFDNAELMDFDERRGRL